MTCQASIPALVDVEETGAARVATAVTPGIPASIESPADEPFASPFGSFKFLAARFDDILTV
jgi:hypothetical protein